MIIGVDFDNTLVCYDDVFLRLAREAGLEGLADDARQKEVREAARRSPGGDLAWQRLQGQAYGSRIQDAQPFPGALEFLRHCQTAGVPTWVISHKTRFAGIDPSHTDLRAAALAWLEHHGFFAIDTGLDAGRLVFGATRQEKIAHIQGFGCTHFIDDLEETFREADFPAGVRRILFAPGATEVTDSLPEVWVARSWSDIEARIFRA